MGQVGQHSLVHSEKPGGGLCPSKSHAEGLVDSLWASWRKEVPGDMSWKVCLAPGLFLPLSPPAPLSLP